MWEGTQGLDNRLFLLKHKSCRLGQNTDSTVSALYSGRGLVSYHVYHQHLVPISSTHPGAGLREQGNRNWNPYNNVVNFSDIGQNFGVVVADINSQYILGAQTAHAENFFKILPLTIRANFVIEIA